MSADQVVWKYTLRGEGALTVPWKAGRTRVTHVQVRAEDPTLVDMWVLRPLEGPGVGPFGERQFTYIGTGMPFPVYTPGMLTETEVVGTTVHAATGLVWHVVMYP
jgi:hypothetical protein